ncbi:AMP-binding protein [Sneathiella marina]|uniref:AMP-binding protein n=1 Tax=Sneathiella marina TaxID=2950108 RepID=A0ABY4W432_9PROT|nr:AMP-binding protein [Sneathiella marina]USG61950.1 AMP-binding protein [Sneathiella marina]
MALISAIEKSHRSMVEGRDVPWLLDQWVTRNPDKPFLVWEPFDGRRKIYTYAEVGQKVDALAGALHAKGITLGDSILIHLDNSPEFIISWFACVKIGAIAVSTNTRSVARDMSYFAEHSGVVAAITQPCFAKLVFDTAPNVSFLILTDNDSGVPASAPEDIPHLAFSDLLKADNEIPTRAVDPHADLSVQFTSGTTSRPKAVLWSHANAIWGAQMSAAHMRLRDDDITQVFLPLFHTNAQSYSMLAMLWVGGTIVVQPKFSASRFWDVARRNKCTWASLIPFCVKALLAQDPPPDHCFRFWGPGIRMKIVEETYGIKTFGWWGMTEIITQGIFGDIDQPGPDLGIGRVAPGYDIEIRDEKGAYITPGSRGLLYIRGVRGVSLFKEYFDNDEANAKAFDDDGWFETGDLIVMDEEGNLFFGDREKDMLKVGGENVAASEIESVINETGWVNECAVVGQKHSMLDEVPVVFLIPSPSAPVDLAAQLVDVCEKNLTDFKVIRDVIIVDEFPRSTLEKIAKNELRARLPTIEA